MQDRFWYRFKNWFRTKPGPGEPLRFLCGSEEELRRVTTWICHLYPQVFDITPVMYVTYKTGDDIVNFARVSGFENGYDDQCASLEPYYALFTYGLGLVGYHNQFTGTEWVCPESIQLYNEPGFPCYRPGFPARLRIVEFGVAITVEVHPPSPHECAEALLSLSEWLDGKVSEQEKRDLLQLPDNFEF